LRKIAGLVLILSDRLDDGNQLVCYTNHYRLFIVAGNSPSNRIPGRPALRMSRFHEMR